MATWQGTIEINGEEPIQWNGLPDLVYKIVKHYVSAERITTFQEIEKKFTKDDTGYGYHNPSGYNFMVSKNEYDSSTVSNKNNRYSNDSPIHIGGDEYYCTTQYGATGYALERFDKFRNFVEKTLGYKITIHGKSGKVFPTSAKIAATSTKDLIEEAIINGKKQIVLTGAPGTGKTHSVIEYVEDQGCRQGTGYEFVQFHPSYDYTDFVEGIRPVESASGMSFVKVDGIFKEFCRKVAEANRKATGDNAKKPENKYYFIIDEINRADLSKVFGELMFCLEDSYRGKPVPTQYRNLQTYEKNAAGKFVKISGDVFENGFFIPENLYIIGTMNDIDKSVEAFDFALRRRFEWIEVNADEVMRSVLQDMQNKKQIDASINIAVLTDKAAALNAVISGEEGKRFGLSKEYHIGPAYYKGVRDLAAGLESIFDHNIASILREYTRGRDNADFVNKCKEALTR